MGSESRVRAKYVRRLRPVAGRILPGAWIAKRIRAVGVVAHKHPVRYDTLSHVATPACRRSRIRIPRHLVLHRRASFHGATESRRAADLGCARQAVWRRDPDANRHPVLRGRAVARSCSAALTFSGETNSKQQQRTATTNSVLAEARRPRRRSTAFGTACAGPAGRCPQGAVTNVLAGARGRGEVGDD